MTVEELLRERYMVMALWPNSEFFEVGEILETSGDCAGKNKTGSGVFQYPIYKPQNFPANLCKLHWSENRELKDMPEYLKHTVQGKTTYHKVNNWDMANLIWYGDGDERGNIKMWHPDHTYQPATESEYLDYINSKTTTP
jgi:hypothetical protein